MKKTLKRERSSSGSEKERGGEVKVLWKVECKEDAEGGQQERSKVVENVMNRRDEERKDRLVEKELEERENMKAKGDSEAREHTRSRT